MRDHTKLRAFEIADDIAVFIYTVTRKFPKEEMYGLTSQMRRAAVSIASNIVEGCTRDSQAEFIRFLAISFGSLKELHYQFGLSYRMGYIKETDFIPGKNKLLEAEKVIGAFIRSLQNPKHLKP